ncbi:MAG: carboxypeptidase regulatory-like domain-containing protein [Bryobacteraceae bacterium]
MHLKIFVTIVSGILISSSCFGQTSTGRIAGIVVDQSRAAIKGAVVTVVDERTNQERATNSNDDGNFAFTGLEPSNYTLRASQSGFANAEIRNLPLQVGQEIRRNLELSVSSTSSVIEVRGGPIDAINASDAKIGVNVTNREVAQLPLNGRQVSQLYLLTPGAVNSGAGTYDNIRFSGRSNQQNIIRYDGVEASSIIDASPGNLNGESTSNFRLQNSLENIQEFRVDSSNYPAEYGTGTGGQISVVTKSGSNQWHGSVFEYLRNDYFDARNFFAGRSVDKLRLNQFGGSAGGKIIENKLFFFATYEGLRQRTASPFVETTLSAAARAQAVPSIQPLLSAFPIGQTPTSNPLLDVVTVNGPGLVDEDYGGLRIDYQISDRYRLYARYFRDQGTSSQTQNSTLSQYNQNVVPQNGVISFSQVWTPRILNEIKFGVNSVKERVFGRPGPSPGVDLTGVTLNLTGSVALSGIAGQTGNAAIATPSGLIRLSSAFNGRGAPYTNYSLSGIDNLSITKGNHNMKFGVEFRPITLYNNQLGGTTYSFSGADTFLLNQPTTIAFNGDLSALSPFTGLSGNAKLQQTYYIGYAQDEWRIRPNFTLNYGLRYEYYGVLSEARNKDVFFDMSTGNIIPRYSGDWYNSSTKNFGPRLGFTWSPAGSDNKTVIRAGAGYYYGPGQTEDQLQPEANDRIGKTLSASTTPGLAYPLNIPSIYANYDIKSSKLGYQPRAYAPGYRIPERILSYSFSVQQELPDSTVITVGYVGSQGRNLFLRSITNLITGLTVDPTTGAAKAVRQFGGRFAEIDYKTSGGTDNYNGFQTTLSRRYSKGLTLGAQYTWAHSIGNSGGSNEANTAGNPFNFQADHGNNNFDVRQSFNIDALYELPFGRGRRFGSNFSNAVDAIFGGWQLGGIVNARSGVPIDVLITRPDIVYVDNRNGDVYQNPLVVNGQVLTTPVINTPGGGSSRNVRRPDVVAGVQPILFSNGLVYINPTAFSVPRPGTFGNSARNSLAGPSFAQLDLTLSKRIRISELFNIELRAEAYNITNHTNFANPGNVRLSPGIPTGPGESGIQPGQPFTSSVAGGNFGALNSTVSNQIGLGTARQLQLALRLNF